MEPSLIDIFQYTWLIELISFLHHSDLFNEIANIIYLAKLIYKEKQPKLKQTELKQPMPLSRITKLNQNKIMTLKCK